MPLKNSAKSIHKGHRPKKKEDTLRWDSKEKLSKVLLREVGAGLWASKRQGK